MLTNALRRGFSFIKPKSQWKQPVRIAVTGANGNIGYAAIFRIASGDMLGHDQPVILHLLDIPEIQDKLAGTAMELDDCAFPLLKDVVITGDPKVALKDIDYGLFIGAKPRGPGMERADLLKDNAKIFIEQGKILDYVAKKTSKILVVGNPANTNCLILQHYAKSIPVENFTAMSRLDHDRGLTMLSKQLKCHINDIQNFAVWGNHSPTMFPDTSHVQIADASGKTSKPTLDQKWINDKFIPDVQKRGTTVINAKKSSSAASAASAALSHVRDWAHGTNGKWTSMCVVSKGEYDIPKGLVFSYPVTTDKGKWKIVEGLKISPEARERLKKTQDELIGERDLVKSMLT